MGVSQINEINALLWALYDNGADIPYIINIGKTLGFKYETGDFSFDDFVGKRVIESSKFKVSFEGAEFFLTFKNQEGFLLVSLTHLTNAKQRTYFGKQNPEIDWPYYIKLMLNLLDNYIPFEFKTGPIESVEGRY